MKGNIKAYKEVLRDRIKTFVPFLCWRITKEKHISLHGDQVYYLETHEQRLYNQRHERENLIQGEW